MRGLEDLSLEDLSHSSHSRKGENKLSTGYNAVTDETSLYHATGYARTLLREKLGSLTGDSTAKKLPNRGTLHELYFKVLKELAAKPANEVGWFRCYEGYGKSEECEDDVSVDESDVSDASDMSDMDVSDSSDEDTFSIEESDSDIADFDSDADVDHSSNDMDIMDVSEDDMESMATKMTMSTIATAATRNTTHHSTLASHIPPHTRSHPASNS